MPCQRLTGWQRASQWQAKDNTGRTAVYNLDSSGNLATTTDTEGKTVTFGYDDSGRVEKITTAKKDTVSYHLSLPPRAR